MSNQINVVYDSEDIRVKAGVFLSDFLLRMAKRNILLLLSGGSSLVPLEYILDNVFQKNITIGLIDERFSSHPEDWNRTAFEKTDFYIRAKKNKCFFLMPIFETSDTCETAAHTYEKKIREWKKKNSQGLVIALIGIGTDGHTAGIMPYPENLKLFMDLFYDQNKWFVGYNAGTRSNYPLRITATIPFLKTIVDYAMVYVSGSAKTTIVAKILDEYGDTHHMPARVIRGMKQVIFFTDQRKI